MGKKINEVCKKVGGCPIRPSAPGSCDKALNACDKALTGLSEENKKQSELLGLQDLRSSQQDKEIERLRTKADSLWNSKWFWFSIGLVGGAAATLYIAK